MIVCFSGTGNSLAVARRLQRPGEELVVLEGEVLNEILKRPVVGTRHGASASIPVVRQVRPARWVRLVRLPLSP